MGNDQGFAVAYSKTYAFVENTSFQLLQSISDKLVPGFYIITSQETGETSVSAKVFYYNGNGANDNNWFPIATSGDGGNSSGSSGTVVSVNGQTPDRFGNVTVYANQIYLDADTNTTVESYVQNLNQVIQNIKNELKTKLYLDEEHQWYQGKAPDATNASEQTLFRTGNLHIDGYYEGKVDGGG